MNPSEQQQARQRIERIAAFRAELAELEREQALALTVEQRMRLDAHLGRVLGELSGKHGVEVTESAQRISWGMRVAALLGGVAFFAALVLFLHRVWGMMPLWGQALVLTGIPLLLLGAAEWTWRRGVDRFYPALLALAAGVGFVMGLSSLGGVLNAVPSPQALLAWAMFAVLVAYAYGHRLLLGGGLLLVCGYVAAASVAASGGFWPNIFDRAGLMIPAAAICYLVPGMWKSRDPHEFAFVYRACGAAVGLIAVMVLSQRGDPCGSALSRRTLEALYQFLGLVASVGVVVHGLRLGRGGLVNLGAVGFIVFLFVRLHAWWWHWMPKYLFFFLVGLIAVGLLLVFRRMRLRLRERVAA